MHRRPRLPLVVALLFPAALPVAGPEANVWVKSDAVIAGQRWGVPVGADSARKLVWAVGQHSHVHALRLDPGTARVAPLK